MLKTIQNYRICSIKISTQLIPTHELFSEIKPMDWWTNMTSTLGVYLIALCMITQQQVITVWHDPLRILKVGVIKKFLFSSFLIWAGRNTSLTPCSIVLIEELTVPQLAKKFQLFYRNRMFITDLTRARHLFLSWTKLIQSEPFVFSRKGKKDLSKMYFRKSHQDIISWLKFSKN